MSYLRDMCASSTAKHCDWLLGGYMLMHTCMHDTDAGACEFKQTARTLVLGVQREQVRHRGKGGSACNLA